MKVKFGLSQPMANTLVSTACQLLDLLRISQFTFHFSQLLIHGIATTGKGILCTALKSFYPFAKDTLINTQISGRLYDISGNQSQFHSLLLEFNGVGSAGFVFFHIRHLVFVVFQDTLFVDYFRCPAFGDYISMSMTFLNIILCDQEMPGHGHFMCLNQSKTN